jgi:two-component system cell cycle sensor histidine kinase/response regulator CckA
VRTRLVTRDGDAIPQPSDAAPGRFALLEIGDTGSGMSSETLSHLFEPFFTTKDVGKGTGLGFATAHGLIAQHRGWIEVESVLGAGSTFRVYLPALDAETAPPVPDAVIEAVASPATVLLVEDEAPVRWVVCRGLRRLGYRVLEAGDGVEALRVWREAGGDAQLLLTDMVMPENSSGLDLALQLHAEKPSLRVVIMSRYDIRRLGDNSRLMEDIEFLGKPFSIVSLGDVVTQLLGTT